MNEAIDWTEHCENKPEVETDLSVIGVLAKEMIELEEQIEEQESVLSALKKKYAFTTQSKLPELMLELGISSIKDEAGRTLSVQQFYQAQITAETRDAAFAYLEDSGNSAIIKSEVKATFAKGTSDEAIEAVNLLEAAGVIASLKTFVHPMTLKSFVKGQIEDGVEGFPRDIFNVYIGNKIKIKK